MEAPIKSDVLRPSTKEKIKPHNTPKGRPFKNKNTIFQGDLYNGNNNKGIKDKIIKIKMDQPLLTLFNSAINLMP